MQNTNPQSFTQSRTSNPAFAAGSEPTLENQVLTPRRLAVLIEGVADDLSLEHVPDAETARAQGGLLAVPSSVFAIAHEAAVTHKLVDIDVEALTGAQAIEADLLPLAEACDRLARRLYATVNAAHERGAQAALVAYATLKAKARYRKDTRLADTVAAFAQVLGAVRRPAKKTAVPVAPVPGKEPVTG